jgi:hypothetical protein
MSHGRVALITERNYRLFGFSLRVITVFGRPDGLAIWNRKYELVAAWRYPEISSY